MFPRENRLVLGSYRVRVEVTIASAEPGSPERVPSKDEILADKEVPAVATAVENGSAVGNADPASLEFHVTIEEGSSNSFLLPIGGEAVRSE